MNRDLVKDKAMCEAATSGLDMEDGENVVWTYYLENCEPELGDNNIAAFKHNKDAVFYIEARQALPYWIAHYEEMERIVDRQTEELTRLRARISELEELVQFHSPREGKE